MINSNSNKRTYLVPNTYVVALHQESCIAYSGVKSGTLTNLQENKVYDEDF